MAGGFFPPHGDASLAHGYGGSFHVWMNFYSFAREWQLQLAPSGYSTPVLDLAWAKTSHFQHQSVSQDQMVHHIRGSSSDHLFINDHSLSLLTIRCSACFVKVEMYILSSPDSIHVTSRIIVDSQAFCMLELEDDNKNSSKVSWYEIVRPQVHGHDLSCLAIFRGPGTHQQICGADEKDAGVCEAHRALIDTLIRITVYSGN